MCVIHELFTVNFNNTYSQQLVYPSLQSFLLKVELQKWNKRWFVSTKEPKKKKEQRSRTTKEVSSSSSKSLVKTDNSRSIYSVPEGQREPSVVP